ncbi:MAG: phosphoribosylamine--glycine ligase [Alphaproteobacteria bacterium]
MRVLVIGGGGREHALCQALLKSPQCKALFCDPGNAGIAPIASCIPLNSEDHAATVAFCHMEKIDFVVIGPETPLVHGLADVLRQDGIPVFGPSQAAAELEGSKGFMKDLCAKTNIPTAKYQRFTDLDAALAYIDQEGAPIVVKADGLASGKGVTVAMTVEEAKQAATEALKGRKFGASGASLVIEEYMEGEEVSFFALCDGPHAIPFASAQDHKRAFDGDEGPNTGGMGAYSPAPHMTPALTEQVMREIVQPATNALLAMGRPFQGVLFAGLMLTKSGPKLIEFNVRFGDPETQAILPRLKSDLLLVLHAAAMGKLDEIALEWDDRAALCVVMAAKGYPGSYGYGSVIKGLDRAAESPDVLVFHAGTAHDGDTILANGGRVLGITGLGATIQEAQQNAYKAIDRIEWKEGFCRRDIGWRAVG